MNNNEDEEEIRKFFEERLRRSGHSLENNVERKLSQIFKIEREPPYLDKDENKGRFGDMLGYAFFPDVREVPQAQKVALGQLILVVECKNIPDNGWIFFENKNEDLGFPEYFSFIRTSKKDPVLESIPIETFPNLFPASGYYEAVLKRDNQQLKTNKKEKNLFEAVMTVIKSTRHHIDETEKVRRSMYRYFNQLGKVVFVTVFQPLIVFTGRMYSTSENESNLKSIKYAQLKKRYESANYNETLGTIHIVQYDALNEYIQLLHKYYWSKSNFIIQHQEDILSLVKESLVRWNDFSPF